MITNWQDRDAQIYHMGTKLDENQNLVTDGGRVLMVVTLSDTLEEAFAHTYEQVHQIECKDLFYRTDIGRKDME